MIALRRRAMKRAYSLPKSLMLIVLISLATEAVAQKSGGVLRRANDENPPSASLREEGSNILSTRDVQRYRDTATPILDHLSKIYVKGEMKAIDTAIWTNVVAKRGYTVGNLRMEDVWLDK
jgi:hypothetical protein